MLPGRGHMHPGATTLKSPPKAVGFPNLHKDQTCLEMTLRHIHSHSNRWVTHRLLGSPLDHKHKQTTPGSLHQQELEMKQKSQ